MPLQNRVTPAGDIIATPERGLMMGNRGGAFHRPDRTLGSRRWASRQWICCVLSFKERHRAVMQPNRYTELFFLDEATALAAGHRPCFECRRDDALRFAMAWARTKQMAVRPSAPEMDEILHAERLDACSGKRTFSSSVAALPAGTFLRLDAPGPDYLYDGKRLFPWSPSGYGPPRDAPPRLPVRVLTPASIVAVLSAGYAPMLHPSALTSC
ncbi:MAG: hypothetical protein EKK41_06455 [Hyphomicrobiales bacterium]|nr:MAG: hypothetical protein EKK41_06455 [Hyphomicrobiales bacterium]